MRPAAKASRPPFRQDVEPASIQVIELVTGAFEQDGKERALQRQTAQLRSRASDCRDDATYEILTHITVPPGRYRLRVGAHNTVVDKSGSVFVDVDVPDFEKDALSLSGFVFSASSAPPVAPADVFQSLIPVVPTTVRQIASNDRATAFLRVYQRRKRAVQSVTVRARMSAPDGSIAYDRTAVLESELFRLAAADFSLHVPTGELSPGPYLLDVEASLPTGETRRRELVFRIR